MTDYDMTDLKTRIRDLVGETTASFFTDDEIEETVNESERMIASLSGCYQMIDATLATVNGIRTVSLTTGAYRAVAVEHDEIFLAEILAKHCGRFPADDNAPRFFYNIPGGIIGIDRVPDDAYSITAYTQNEPQGIITPPALAIGTTKTNVASSEFDYWISGVKYTKAAVAAGTILSGDDVPQNTYGAWRLEIASDENIDIVAATANSAGYASAALARAGLPTVSDNHTEVGTVTVINTSAAFDPGTTLLDAAGVTAEYIDSGAMPKIPRQFWLCIILLGLARCLRRQKRIAAADQIVAVVHGELRFFSYDFASQTPDGWADYRYE